MKKISKKNILRSTAIAVFITFIGLLSLTTYTQPTAAATSLPSGFTDTPVASGLNQPTAMEFSPDGRLFVNEKGGTVRIIKNGELLPTPFHTLTVNNENERGLLGIAFDPNYTNNRYIYLYYTRASEPIKNRVSRFKASNTNPEVVEENSETILLDNIPSDAGNHNGGAIHFGGDNKLYIAVGDGGSNSANAQDLSNLSGKILRINNDGTIPADNPFYNQENKRAEIWIYGLRNPYTFAFNTANNDMLINDVGANKYEEINKAVKGANYGWPICEGPCDNNNFVNPIHYYDHTVGNAITGGTFYTATQFPLEYQSTYYFADYTTDWIKRITPSDTQSTNFASGISGAVDLKQGPDGAIYYLSISQGAISKIEYQSTSPTPTNTPTPTPTPSVTATPTPSPSPTASPTPTVTPTPINTATPTPTITSSPTAQSTQTPTPIPTYEPTPTATTQPTTTPSTTPVPSPQSTHNPWNKFDPKVFHWFEQYTLCKKIIWGKELSFLCKKTV